MKHQISSRLAAGLFSTFLAFCAGCLQSVGPVESVADSAGEQPQIVAEANEAEEANDISEVEHPAKEDVSFAAVTNISNEIAIPSNLHPGPGTIEVIKLANSGVDETVMVSFVTNSTERFSLGPEEIIYLNDIGLSGRIITALSPPTICPSTNQAVSLTSGSETNPPAGATGVTAPVVTL